jgi:hypothetical protein
VLPNIKQQQTRGQHQRLNQCRSALLIEVEKMLGVMHLLIRHCAGLTLIADNLAVQAQETSHTCDRIQEEPCAPSQSCVELLQQGFHKLEISKDP